MPDTAPVPAPWPVLSLVQRRVLGVLVEKQKTTPDVYPMTLNGVVTGCNQKSNRDPILSLTDVEAEESLARLQKLGLVMRVDSGCFTSPLLGQILTTLGGVVSGVMACGMKAAPVPVRMTTRLSRSSPMAWNRSTNCSCVCPLNTSFLPSV